MEGIPGEKPQIQRCGVVVLDHTYRLATEGAGHLNANRFVRQIQRMRAEHLLDDDIFSKPRTIGDVGGLRT